MRRMVTSISSICDRALKEWRVRQLRQASVMPSVSRGERHAERRTETNGHHAVRDERERIDAMRGGTGAFVSGSALVPAAPDWNRVGVSVIERLIEELAIIEVADSVIEAGSATK